MPIRRGEEIPFFSRVMQVRRQPNDCFPVAPTCGSDSISWETNRELPSDAIPPGAQMPPPRARVAQLEIRCGLDIETPTTNPRYWPQSP
jgi:hypothetical protein